MAPEVPISELDVSGNLLAQLLTYAAGHGIHTGDVLRRHELPVDILSYPDRRIDAATYLALQNDVALRTGDAAFGFHLGQTSEPGNFSILGYIMMNCRILGEALRMSEKYHRFMGTLFEWNTSLGLTSFTTTARPKNCAVSESRHCVEATFYLGFSDSAAFSKYFKKRTGSSPTEFRRQMLFAATLPATSH